MYPPPAVIQIYFIHLFLEDLFKLLTDHLLICSNLSEMLISTPSPFNFS